MKNNNKKYSFIKYLPNIITGARVFLVLVIIILVSFLSSTNLSLFNNTISIAYNNNSNSIIWLSIFSIFAIATITDFLDGYIAHKYNVISKFGKVFDSIADKMLTIVTLIILSVFNVVFLWITLLLILREIIINSIRIMNPNENKIIEAKWHGKLKTVLLFIGILFSGFLAPVKIDIQYNQWIYSSVLILALFASFFSLFKYAYSIFKIKHPKHINLPKQQS